MTYRESCPIRRRDYKRILGCKERVIPFHPAWIGLPLHSRERGGVLWWGDKIRKQEEDELWFGHSRNRANRSAVSFPFWKPKHYRHSNQIWQKTATGLQWMKWHDLLTMENLLWCCFLNAGLVFNISFAKFWIWAIKTAMRIWPCLPTLATKNRTGEFALITQGSWNDRLRLTERLTLRILPPQKSQQGVS